MSTADDEKKRERRARADVLRAAIIARRQREREEAEWQESEETRCREEAYLGWARTQQSQPREEQKRRNKKKSISCRIL